MDKHLMLVVVDMQNDFLTGSLANPDAVKCIPVIKNAINDAGCIVFTRDTHEDSYLTTQEGRNLPVEHCIRGTHGWNVCQELIDAASSTDRWWDYLDKKSFGYNWSGFYLSPAIDEVVFCGTCTDICVISNVINFKTVFPEVPVKVLEAGCTGTSSAAHKAALKVMKSLQVEII